MCIYKYGEFQIFIDTLCIFIDVAFRLYIIYGTSLSLSTYFDTRSVGIHTYLNRWPFSQWVIGQLQGPHAFRDGDNILDESYGHASYRGATVVAVCHLFCTQGLSLVTEGQKRKRERKKTIPYVEKMERDRACGRTTEVSHVYVPALVVTCSIYVLEKNASE